MPIRGWVYVLSNPQMPDLLKIGYSKKDPALRAVELQTTGVASPFKVEYDVLVFDPEILERKLHDQLKDFRTAGNREFFKITIEDVVKVIRNAGFVLLYEQGFDVPPPIDLRLLAPEIARCPVCDAAIESTESRCSECFNLLYR